MDSSNGRCGPYRTVFPFLVSPATRLPWQPVAICGRGASNARCAAWRDGRVVMQRPAKPWTPVRFRLPPPKLVLSHLAASDAGHPDRFCVWASTSASSCSGLYRGSTVELYWPHSRHSPWSACKDRQNTANDGLMNRQSHALHNAIRNALLLLSVLIASVSGGVVAAADPAGNSRYDVLGTGQDCREGYKRTGTTCVQVRIPENARLNVIGNDWVCNPGYRRLGKTCTPVNIPPNASIDLLTNDWRCNPGFRRQGSGCVAVRNRDNAHINALGNDWECDRGYRPLGSGCVAIQVPPNAKLNSFGDGWECRPGYRRLGSRCEMY